MYYGLQLATSGILTGLYRSDVLGNNLANTATVGFKPESVFTQPRQAARDEDGLFSLPSNRLLERLGAGPLLSPNHTSFGQGPLETTGNDLDLAIQGDGFFVLRDLADGGNDAVKFTRDGRFELDRQGRLVSATSGLPVLAVGNQPIALTGEGRVTIDGDGLVRQGDRFVGRLEVVDVPDRTQLVRGEGTLFTPSASAYENRFEASGRVRQGELEQSSAGGIDGVLAFQRATGSVSGNTRIAGYHDELMNAAINRFGRVG